MGIGGTKRKGWEGGDYHHGQLILREPASLYKKLGASPLNSLNLDGSGTKTKSYKPVAQIPCISVQFFGTKRTHSPVPGLKGGKPFFPNFKVFLVCPPIVD
jgi:hypothetical protein